MISAMLVSVWLQSATTAIQRGNRPATVAEPVGVELLRREAKALEPLVESPLARAFLKATSDLPAVSPRTLYVDEAKHIYLNEDEARSSKPEARRVLKRFPVDESFYYTTKYGSPLAYVRPIDLLGRSGFETVAGRKVLDFGYGTIGPLRLLAGLGADATGVDVDPLLRALYSARGDQGMVAGRRGPAGRLRVIDGRFPADSAVRAAVGAGYDLIISKNTLKRGYVHPERPVELRRLLNLSVTDADFVQTLHQALKPGGRLLIYNICPAPSPPGRPYKNWADGHCPFPRSVWEAAGFRVLSFDVDDSGAIREIARALGWDRGEAPIDLKTDLFAMYSMFQA
jgi:SAM-dependent methyltransferase